MTMPPPPPPPPMSQVQIEEGIRPAPPPNTRVSGVVVCMNVINTITHLLLGMVAFSAFFFTNMFPFAANFTAHVYLCVIGVSTIFFDIEPVTIHFFFRHLGMQQ